MYELCLLKNKMKQCADISAQMYLPDKVFSLTVILCVLKRDVCPACSEDEKEIKNGQPVFKVCLLSCHSKFLVLGTLFWLQQTKCTCFHAL